MKRVLVTGGRGFIGGHLIERLVRDGLAVRALVRTVRPDGLPWPSSVEVMQGDIQDSEAMKAAAAGCDTVFHLAARVHDVSAIQRDEALYWSVNVDGTRNVLEGMAQSGATHFIFFSSVKASGGGVGSSGCLDESVQEPPADEYGRTKLAAERLVLDYGKQKGLHVVCLRLPLVYGPGNKGNLFRMIAAIDRGLFPPLPPDCNRRSWIHVGNVVEAALLAATHPSAAGQVYIVTDTRPYSTREIHERVARELGARVPRWHVPLWTLTMLARAGDLIGRLAGRRFPLDSDALEKLAGSAWYTSAKISRELGYRPLVGFENALPELIAWYRTTRS